jgi:hypothetical protein
MGVVAVFICKLYCAFATSQGGKKGKGGERERVDYRITL